VSSHFIESRAIASDGPFGCLHRLFYEDGNRHGTHSSWDRSDEAGDALGLFECNVTDAPVVVSRIDNDRSGP
jgi:hypothetical protein